MSDYLQIWTLQKHQKLVYRKNAQNKLLDMIMAALLKHRIELPPEYNNYGELQNVSYKKSHNYRSCKVFSTGMWHQQHKYYLHMG